MSKTSDDKVNSVIYWLEKKTELLKFAICNKVKWNRKYFKKKTHIKAYRTKQTPLEI